MTSNENIGTLHNSSRGSYQLLEHQQQQGILSKWDKATNSLELDLSDMKFWIWDEQEHYRIHKEKKDMCCRNI